MTFFVSKSSGASSILFGLVLSRLFCGDGPGIKVAAMVWKDEIWGAIVGGMFIGIIEVLSGLFQASAKTLPSTGSSLRCFHYSSRVE
jgi:hypothetical protein